jgi:hypothetical protein
MLARWCHVSPTDVDALPVRDFLILTEGIDREIAERKAANDG